MFFFLPDIYIYIYIYQDISLGQLFVFKFGRIELKLGIDFAKKFKQKNDKTTHQVAIMGCVNCCVDF